MRGDVLPCQDDIHGLWCDDPQLLGMRFGELIDARIHRPPCSSLPLMTLLASLRPRALIVPSAGWGASPGGDCCSGERA